MDKILTVGRKSHHSLLSKQLFIARTSDTRSPTFDSENAANQFLTTPSPFTRIFFLLARGGGGVDPWRFLPLCLTTKIVQKRVPPKTPDGSLYRHPRVPLKKKIINEKEIKEQPYYYAILSLEEFWLQTSNSIVS